MRTDYLIVGAGLWGSTFARELTDLTGANCIIIDKRNHVAGNCYDEEQNGILVHKYGAHIFHTKSTRIWEWINKFTRFNHYRHHVKAMHNGKLYSLPISLETIYQVYGIKSPDTAEKIIEEETKNAIKKYSIKDKNADIRSFALSAVGELLYEMFIKGYTIKQWGRLPETLPASIIRRLPIRYYFNNDYFDDEFQGIPVDGYTKMIKNIQEGILILLNADYFDFQNLECKKVVYTGPIDALLNYSEGILPYRTLKFKTKEIPYSLQGTATINYTNEDIAYTRITEHKYFYSKVIKHSIYSIETPGEHSINLKTEPYYPIRTDINKERYNKYLDKINRTWIANFDGNNRLILGGRLAEYQYYNMDQIIGSALLAANKEAERFKMGMKTINSKDVLESLEDAT